MNALDMAQNAYGASKARSRTPRDTEYELFARTTGRLKAARDKGKAGFPELAAALHDNHRLWTALATDLAQPENALPDALRGELLSLANFSVAHGEKVRRGQADIDPLIEVNTAIMRGLAPAAAA